MTEAKQRTGTPFKGVGATGVFVYVELFENYARSMELLKQNGLRPLTYQEALVLIDRNPEPKGAIERKLVLFGWKTSQNIWIPYSRVLYFR